MSLQDYLRNFADLQICRVFDQNKYTYRELKCPNQATKFYKIEGSAHGHYFVTANQDSERLYPKGSYKYSQVTMVLGQVNNGQGKYFGSISEADREVWVGGEFDGSPVYLSIKVDWFDGRNKTVGFAVYGPSEVRINELSPDLPETQSFLTEMFKARGRQEQNTLEWSQHPCSPAIRLAFKATDEGFAYFYYQNGTDQDLNETLILKCSNSVRVCPPYSGNNIRFIVPARGEHVVLLTFSGESNEFGYSNEGTLGNYGGNTGGRGGSTYPGMGGSTLGQSGSPSGYGEAGGRGSYAPGKTGDALILWVEKEGMPDHRLDKSGNQTGVSSWIAKDPERIYYMVRNQSGKKYCETVRFDLNNCRIEGDEEAEGLEFELEDGEQTMITLVKLAYAREFSMNFKHDYHFE